MNRVEAGEKFMLSSEQVFFGIYSFCMSLLEMCRSKLYCSADMQLSGGGTISSRRQQKHLIAQVDTIMSHLLQDAALQAIFIKVLSEMLCAKLKNGCQ